jgi:hypothetical protein
VVARPIFAIAKVFPDFCLGCGNRHAVFADRDADQHIRVQDLKKFLINRRANRRCSSPAQTRSRAPQLPSVPASILPAGWEAARVGDAVQGGCDGDTFSAKGLIQRSMPKKT